MRPVSPKTLRLFFFLCSVLVFGALVWVSSMLLRSESARQVERQKYDRDRDLVVALWTLDAEILNKLLSPENDHPYFDYQAFFAPDRPYNAMLGPPFPGERLKPSPFLEAKSDLRRDLVRIRFLITPDGTVTSPEAPDQALIEAAGYTKSLPENARLLYVLRASFRANDFINAALLAPYEADIRASGTRKQYMSPFAGGTAETLQHFSEQQARTGTFSSWKSRFGSTAEILRRFDADTTPTPAPPAKTGSQSLPLIALDGNTPEFDPDSFYPIWIESELFLLRTLKTDQGTVIQGIWLDWQALNTWLKSLVSDRFPNASLIPAVTTLESPSSFQYNDLATLPVRLIPGTRPVTGELPSLVSSPISSPERIALLSCWASAILAITGIGILLNATISLSERRATFVSAVTHELRTPLTTFQLYTEMLADGMIPPESQKSYLDTLHAEAGRLIHLVENVLGFARLEKGRALRRDETLSVGEILDRVAPRIKSRLDAAVIELRIQKQNDIEEILLRTDGTAVEQILFNLADNAAKYAGGGDGKEVVLSIFKDNDGENIGFLFADNGPGIAPSARKKLFHTFNRSSEEAAGKKPGVGLGLAFSRQLARRLGGDLKLAKTDATGTAFILRLPVN